MHAVRRILAASPLLLLLAAIPARGEEKTPAPAPAGPTAPAAPGPTPPLTITLADGKTAKCLEQAAQPFLIRGNWFPRTNDAEKLKEGRKLLEDAIKYRTEKYGYFEGFGSPKSNPHPPRFYAKTTPFFGTGVQVHEKIIPALKCVEAALKAGPAAAEYAPHSYSGMRFKNTYKGVEVSNHLYGIALDIEPNLNKCCGCVPPWSDDPVCKKTTDVWKRMVMPKSWVDTFERYGFYWLGHDVLQDTMHFEFLGDPDKIVEAP